MGQAAGTAAGRACRIDGEHLVEGSLRRGPHPRQLLGPEQVANDHEAVAMEQLGSSLDIARIEHLEPFDPVVRLSFSRNCTTLGSSYDRVQPAHAGSPPMRL